MQAQEFEQNHESFLYLLKASCADAFKIGNSRNVAARLRKLPQQIDLDGSLQVSVADSGARAVERLLHHMFRRDKYEMPHGDGYTEWFDASVWEEVVGFLKSQRERLGVGSLSLVVLPEPAIPQLDPEAQRALDALEKERLNDLSKSATVHRVGLVFDCLRGIFECDVEYWVSVNESTYRNEYDVSLIGSPAEIAKCWSLFTESAAEQLLLGTAYENHGLKISLGASARGGR